MPGLSSELTRMLFRAEESCKHAARVRRTSWRSAKITSDVGIEVRRSVVAAYGGSCGRAVRRIFRNAACRRSAHHLLKIRGKMPNTGYATRDAGLDDRQR